MEVTLPAPHLSIVLPVGEMSAVDGARRYGRWLAQAHGFNESDAGRVALVETEAATNIVQHAGRGEILLRPLLLESPVAIEMLALDRGPGIAQVARALQDGFSTGGSAGLGLGAMVRLSTLFDITSAVGKGTAVLSRIAPAGVEPAPGGGLEFGVVCAPQHGEEVCGDAWAVTRRPGRSSVLIVDGLGHGPLAFEAAQQVAAAFRAQAGEGPEQSLRALHETMRANRASRGAVAAVLEVDWRRREVRYAGAGNIAGSLVPPEGRIANLVSHSGTLGDNVTHFQEFTHRWPEEGLLILHSDGLGNPWELEPYPGLSRKHPSLIAGVLYRDFASRRDDVVVLVGRERAKRSTKGGAP